MRMTVGSQQDDRLRYSVLVAILLVTVVSGFITLPANPGQVWVQWTYLLHTLQGVLLTLIVANFVYRHYLRTVGVRRIALSITGILSVLISSVFIGTGLLLAVYGQQESDRYVYWLHIYSAAIAVSLVFGHVVWHRISLPERRRSEYAGILSVQSATVRRVLLYSVVSAAVVGLCTVVYQGLPSIYRDEAAISPYEYVYGDEPFTPSYNKTASGGFYDPKRTGGSAQCGECHAEIFKHWKSSMHAQAASDKAYQTNINLLAKKKGMAATRYCEGCHAPVAIMAGYLSEGGRLDTHGHLQEGVSCLSCHAISQILDTSGVASYMYDPPKTYLFADYEQPLARQLHNYLVRINPALHRREMARAPLTTPELCATCHAQFMEKVMNNWGWVKMQDDYTAWLKGPFSGQSNQTFSQTQVQRCQDCHYPLIAGEDPSADGNGMQRSHQLPGANTAIPFINGDHQQVALHTRFLQSNKINVTIDKPTRMDALRSQRPIDPSISDVTEPPGYYYLGEEVTINTVVANIGVGHEFPGGTIDINEAWVQFTVTDGQNRVIFQSGAIDDNGDVDASAYFYRSLPVDKEGQLVWRHDLFRMVGDSFRNVIRPGAADVVTYRFKIPSWAKHPMHASAVVRYRKLNTRYAKWALEDEYVPLPIVDVASDAIAIPIREKIEAAGTM